MLMGDVPLRTIPMPAERGIAPLQMLTGFLLRRRVFLRMIPQAQTKSIQKRRLHRFLVYLLMTKDKYRKRVGGKDFYATSA